MSIQLAIDTFARANENPLSGGGVWTPVPVSVPNNIAGLPQLLTNKVQGTAFPGYHFAYINALVWPNDQYAEITVSLTNGEYVFPGVRMQNNGDGYYGLAITNTGVSTIYIQRKVGAIATNILGPISITTIIPGDLIRIEALGGIFTLKINNVAVGSIFDTTFASGSAGCGVYVTTTIANATISKFTAGSLQASDISSCKQTQTGFSNNPGSLSAGNCARTLGKGRGPLG